MKINNDCARQILLEIEKIPYGETLKVEKLQEKISEFSIEDILFIVSLFNHERYISVLNKACYDDGELFRDNKIQCLTERGYKALDLIRSEDIWNLMKEKISNFDELSIFTIIHIANKIVNVKHNEILDLPKDLLLDYLKIN